MPKHEHQRTVDEIQDRLRKLVGHDQIRVKPYGSHLLIQLEQDGEADTIARLTDLGRTSYGAAFRTHTGRWEPLPGTGSIQQMAELVTQLLAPYLQPNY